MHERLDTITGLDLRCEDCVFKMAIADDSNWK